MAGPPGALIARLMQGVVMAVAQRHGELIRHLEPERARLREANVMRLGWAPPANEAGLAGDEGEVRPIADALVFWEEQLTSICGGRRLRLLRCRRLNGLGGTAGFASLRRRRAARCRGFGQGVQARLQRRTNNARGILAVDQPSTRNRGQAFQIGFPESV